MSSNPDFDRWYAAKNAKFVLEPSHCLETFGSTVVNYHLVSELSDYPNKVRIREGRLEAHPPLVITPQMPDVQVDGFGEAAREYIDFIRSHIKDLRILRYGYHLKSDNFSEQIVTGRLPMVTAHVAAEVKAKNDPCAAVVQCVDDPWDVALVELWLREINRSAPTNIRELNEKGFLYGKED